MLDFVNMHARLSTLNGAPPPVSRDEIEKRSHYQAEMIRHAQEQKQKNAGER